MRKRRAFLLGVLPVIVLGGLVYAGAYLGASRHAGSFICPLTGEELPCPKCCPLNHHAQVRHDGNSRAADGGLIGD